MKDNILLTGATGFIGTNLLKRLIDSGYNVRCIIRNKKKLSEIKHLNAEFVFGDITKRSSLKNSIRNIDVIFHLAVKVSVAECLKNPRKAFETNISGTLNLLEEIRKETINRTKKIFFIYISSDRVYGRSGSNKVDEKTIPYPTDPYSASKLNSELLIRCYNACYSNPTYIILRSANVYGYGQSTSFFIPSVINQVAKGKKEIKIGNMGYYRNFVHINDLINALMLILEKKNQCKNQIFNISESSVKMSHVLSLIEKFTVNYLNKSLEFSESKQLARSANLEFNKFILDCSKIKKIGWKPEIKFEDGLKQTFCGFLK